jgi:hypothetical protein
MKERRLEYKFARKRIVKERRLPVLCRDYEKRNGSDDCLKADICKNATYAWDNMAWGTCYGGTRKSERESRKSRIVTINRK